MEFEAIAKQLLKLKSDDLALRDKLIINDQLSHGYNEAMEQLHNRNATILDQIIDSIGYPTIGKVGKEASEAAWLIIQHSIGQPAFMKKCLFLLEDVVSQNQADPINLAYLSDRIATFEGRLQQYGTQFDWDEHGQLSSKPLDDINAVNKRRASLGLNTVEQQTAIIRQQAKDDHQSPPSNYKERIREETVWKKLVGWLQ